MSVVDQKYISLVSPRLQKFSKKNKLYTFRCPYCGDSQKYKNKTRGYLYPIKNDYNFRCHNCGVSRSFSNFLKDQDQVIYDQYVMERYKKGTTGRRSNTPNPKIKFEKPVFNKSFHEIDLDKISSLNKKHPARIYLEQTRHFPSKTLDDLYYCEHFKEWTNNQKPTFDNVVKDEPRIIIPLRYNGELIGYQGRSLLPDSKIKYITIMLKEDAPKVYGLDEINDQKPIYIVEGPFDSTFLENSVAMCGSDVNIGSFGWCDYIYVYDNEPRNRQIVDRITKTIDRGDKVVIFPKDIMEKDINDMVLSGRNVQKLVESNTYQGLEAKLQLQIWKRV